MDATKTMIIDLFHDALVKRIIKTPDEIGIRLDKILTNFEQQVKNNCDKSNVSQQRELLIDFQAHIQDCSDDHIVRYDVKADKYLKSINCG